MSENVKRDYCTPLCCLAVSAGMFLVWCMGVAASGWNLFGAFGWLMAAAGWWLASEFRRSAHALADDEEPTP